MADQEQTQGLAQQLAFLQQMRFYEAAFVQQGGSILLGKPDLIASEYGLTFPGSWFTVLQFYLDCAQGSPAAASLLPARNRAVETAQQVLEPVTRALVFYIQTHSVFVIANYDQALDIHALCRSMLSQLCPADGKPSVEANLAYSLPVTRLEDLPQAVAQVRFASEVRLTKGYRRIFSYARLQKEDIGLVRLSGQDRDELAQAVFFLDAAQCRDKINALIYDGINAHDCLCLSIQIIDVCVDALNSMVEGFVVKNTHKELAVNAPPMPEDLNTIGEIRFSILRWITSKLELLRNEPRDLKNPRIRSAIYYLYENYQRPLQMKDVAGHVQLQPAYFSTRFKQETGLAFTDFLKRIRIQEACLLLAQTDRRVHEISTAVGFENSRYFSQVFAAQTGMTPTQYRAAHSRLLASGEETNHTD